ncbi:MAG: hypothetical protein FWC41_00130 [Firmicutes bacterium]|nr:hypothetical protein [Bacillota bacterium]
MKMNLEAIVQLENLINEISERDFPNDYAPLKKCKLILSQELPYAILYYRRWNDETGVFTKYKYYVECFDDEWRIYRKNICISEKIKDEQ